MRAPLEAALEAVALRLSAAGVPFLLGGSALLDALGLDVEVRDIDLMLRPRGPRARSRRPAREWLVAVTTEPGEVLTSDWKATLDVGGVEVEGLGGLGVAGGAGRAVPGGRLAPLRRVPRSRCAIRPSGWSSTASTSPRRRAAARASNCGWVGRVRGRPGVEWSELIPL